MSAKKARRRARQHLIDSHRDHVPDGLALARADWLAAPEIVRAETWRCLAELNEGRAALRPLLARAEALQPYAAMAAAGGTTLIAACENYFGMEALLRQDVIGGLHLLCGNLGIDPVRLGHALMCVDANGANHA